MTCRYGFVRKKSQAPRLTRRKTRKLAVQTSSKEVDATNNDELRRYSPMTAFPEFVIPADVGQERVFPDSTPGAIAPISAAMSVHRELDRRNKRAAATLEPCLPRKANMPANGSGWIHEIKHDGFRILAQKIATKSSSSPGTAMTWLIAAA